MEINQLRRITILLAVHPCMLKEREALLQDLDQRNNAFVEYHRIHSITLRRSKTGTNNRECQGFQLQELQECPTSH